MNITIISVGKLKEKYIKQGIDEYAKRLGSYCKLQLIEVPDEKAPENLSEKEMEQVKDKEGEKILSKIKDSDTVIAMAIEGDLISSEQLAEKIENYGINATIRKKQGDDINGACGQLRQGVLEEEN